MPRPPRLLPCPGDRPHYLQDRNVDIDHIKLTVSFDLDNKQVIGKAELRMRPIVDGVQRIELDCEDTKVHSVSVGMTKANFVLDGKKLRIELPRRYSRGRTFLLVIEYVATPQQGIYFTGPDEGYPDKPIQIWTQGQDTDNHHWFPCIDEPKGRLTSEIVATVPSSWTVISNGRLISDRRNREDGTRTVRWLQDKKTRRIPDHAGGRRVLSRRATGRGSADRLLLRAGPRRGRRESV